MSSHYFLEKGDTISIDGVEMTFEDIKESKIDSMLYRKHLEELQQMKSE